MIYSLDKINTKHNFNKGLSHNAISIWAPTPGKHIEFKNIVSYFFSKFTGGKIIGSEVITDDLYTLYGKIDLIKREIWDFYRWMK